MAVTDLWLVHPTVGADRVSFESLGVLDADTDAVKIDAAERWWGGDWSDAATGDPLTDDEIEGWTLAETSRSAGGAKEFIIYDDGDKTLEQAEALMSPVKVNDP